MIEFTVGDILQADVEALVNPVNCVGVMGRGLALAFKAAFPGNFVAYERACARGDVLPGRMFVFATGHLARPKYIINFPTKRHWREKSRIEDIEAGLGALRDEVERLEIRSIAVPALGAGLGGLAWGMARKRIESALADLPNTRVTVFEPSDAPQPTRLGLRRRVRA